MTVLEKAGAWHLLNRTLDSGWEVFETVGWDANSEQKTCHYDETGGHFSVAYKVRRGEKVAFLKAIDLTSAMHSQDVMAELLSITQAHAFETRILSVCADARMDKVVVAIESGQIKTGPNIQELAPYLIFELADGDVRRRIQNISEANVRLAWWLRAMHHAAVGINQLHSKQIYHQDIKPSNILSFGRSVGFKIADLGRAQAAGETSPHSKTMFAGDLSYAPPEILYQHYLPDDLMRQATCDLYMLGSMVFFFALGAGATQLLMDKIDHPQRPQGFHGEWSGTYEQIAPFLQHLFTDLLETLESNIGQTDIGKRLVTVASELCTPTIENRGHPSSRVRGGRLYSLERYVSLFDILAKKAEIAARSPGRK